MGDYYQLTAFFNNLKELGMTGDDGNYGPMHLLKTPQQKERLSRLETEIESKEQELTTVGESFPFRDATAITSRIRLRRRAYAEWRKRSGLRAGERCPPNHTVPSLR